MAGHRDDLSRDHTNRESMSLESWLVAGGRNRGPGDPLNTPIVPASNFVHGGTTSYSRDDGTSTIAALEDLIGGLEGGHAVAYSSGMAAANAVFATMPAGASVAIPEGCYQGVAGLASEAEQQGFIAVRRIAVTDTDAWRAAVGSADLVWLESPSNPLLEVADLPAICASPRKPGNVIAVDNTFATPINQRPLEAGADIAMHSLTKFIGGHSDLLAGILVARDPEMRSRFRHGRVLSGSIPGALEAYLATRGARTLALRLERSQTSAAELAARLSQSPSVDIVRYPGLASDPNHAVASRVLDGFGAIISFDIACDDRTAVAERADAVCARLRLITHATSLGGIESTMERRASLAGQEDIPPGLLRLSVGCEDVEDLWADLQQAIAD